MLEAIAGCIIDGFVGSIITMKLVSVLVRRNESGEITCRKLTVVDAYGMERVVLGTYPYDREVHGPNYYGGFVSVLYDGGQSGVTLGINKHGGHVKVDGNDRNSTVKLAIDEHGGSVAAFGKGFGNDGKTKAVLGTDGHGGHVGVHGKDGKSEAWLRIYKDGGAVSTWDKNGDRHYGRYKALD